MGFGIAVNFALAGYQTLVYDLTDETLQQSLEKARSALDLFADEGVVSREHATEAAARISTTTDVERLAAHGEFITEAIVELLPEKQALFESLDRICPRDTILVSNTSSFLLSDIALNVKRQELIALTHYFAPPHLVPGVEVARGPSTSDETYQIVCELMRRTGRVPIPVRREVPGYLINRLSKALYQEALRLWAEGVATAEDIELGVKSTIGFRMPFNGPFGHYDISGAWKWPVPEAGTQRTLPEPGSEVLAKMQARMAERRPWFLDLNRVEDVTRERDKEFVRRRQALYGTPRYEGPSPGSR